MCPASTTHTNARRKGGTVMKPPVLGLSWCVLQSRHMARFAALPECETISLFAAAFEGHCYGYGCCCLGVLVRRLSKVADPFMLCSVHPGSSFASHTHKYTVPYTLHQHDSPCHVHGSSTSVLVTTCMVYSCGVV